MTESTMANVCVCVCMHMLQSFQMERFRARYFHHSSIAYCIDAFVWLKRERKMVGKKAQRSFSFPPKFSMKSRFSNLSKYHVFIAIHFFDTKKKQPEPFCSKFCSAKCKKMSTLRNWKHTVKYIENVPPCKTWAQIVCAYSKRTFVHRLILLWRKCYISSFFKYLLNAQYMQRIFPCFCINFRIYRRSFSIVFAMQPFCIQIEADYRFLASITVLRFHFCAIFKLRFCSMCLLHSLDAIQFPVSTHFWKVVVVCFLFLGKFCITSQ